MKFPSASTLCLSLLFLVVGVDGEESSLRGLQQQSSGRRCGGGRVLEARIRNPEADRCKDGVCGWVTFQCTENNSDLTEIHYDISGLTPNQQHALHVHELRVGDDCLATGGHWNPENMNHGSNLE